MAKYCSNCGRELPDEAIYCPDCGKKFIPRYKADDSDSVEGSSSTSDYEFNGPFGPSSKKFEGPFGLHSNRGSDDAFVSSSENGSSSSKDYTPSSSISSDGHASSSSSASNDHASNSSSSSPFNFENIGCGKLCLILFVVLLLLSAIGNLARDHSSNDYDSSVLSDSANNLYNNDYNFYNQNLEGKGSISGNEPYNISIEGNAYLSGKGEAKLIDSNHSYNIKSEEFNITEYETYYVNVDDNDWYVLDVFKCKFENASQNQVYATDLSDGDPIIIYAGKGDYYGYGIIIPNSSDNSTYKNIDFLESIFHFNKVN